MGFLVVLAMVALVIVGPFFYGGYALIRHATKRPPARDPWFDNIAHSDTRVPAPEYTDSNVPAPQYTDSNLQPRSARWGLIILAIALIATPIIFAYVEISGFHMNIK
jgi:hypothetical protein